MLHEEYWKHSKSDSGEKRTQNVMPDVRIPEREERRLPRQCNLQKKGSLLLTRVRAPAAHPSGTGSESTEPKLLPSL